MFQNKKIDTNHEFKVISLHTEKCTVNFSLQKAQNNTVNIINNKNWKNLGTLTNIWKVFKIYAGVIRRTIAKNAKKVLTDRL